MNMNVTEFKSYRIGRPGTKPRPLKLILRDSSVVNSCLRNKRGLGDSAIRIRADLTVLQRSQLRRTYEELNERIADGERDVAVRFVCGVPKVVVISKN